MGPPRIPGRFSTDGVNGARDDVFVVCPELGIDMPDSFSYDRPVIEFELLTEAT